MGVEYQDFEIEIGSDSAEGTPRRYFAHVIRSPAGEASRSPVQFRFSEPKSLPDCVPIWKAPCSTSTAITSPA